MIIGLLYSRIREDEKLLLEELRGRNHEVRTIDVRSLCFDLDRPPSSLETVDVAINRAMESSRVRYVAQFVDHYGVRVVNDPETARICADKVRGSLALQSAGVPTPRTEVSLGVDAALDSIERFGYPCLIKPVTGSWGRLIAKIDTRSAAEAVLEHKDTLGHYEHKVFYVQEFVEKPDRDIRVVATDGKPVAAMTRSSEHWLTNAARGATVEAFEVDEAALELVERASAAVGGGLLGIDLMETPAGYTVHEVNSTCEFKALNRAVPDVDVPARLVDWIETRLPA